MKKMSSIATMFVIVLWMLASLPTINSTSLSWSSRLRLTTDPSTDQDPCISQDSSGKIYVFFTSHCSGLPQIWYMTTLDLGITWSTPQLFLPTQYPASAHYISEVCLFEDSTGRLWVAWSRWVEPSQADIYFSISDDGGVTWSDSRLLVSYPDDDHSPSFVEVGGEIWLVFSSWGISSNWNIYYIKTSNGGLTWSPPQGIVVSPFRHDYVDVLRDLNGKIWVVYTNLTSPYDPSTSDIWCVTTSDGGSTWSQPKQITSFPSEEGSRLSLVEFEGSYYLFYTDRYNPDIWFVTSHDGGITWSSTPNRIDSDTAQDQYPNAAVIKGNLWVVWQSDKSGNWDIWASKTAEVSANIHIDPNTLNLKSNGEFVTIYIELPAGYNLTDIDLATVKLEGISAITDPQYGFVTDPTSYLVDHDGDGIMERLVKFNRATVRDALTSMIDYEEGIKFYELTLKVTGTIAGTPFEGSDTIVVIKK